VTTDLNFWQKRLEGHFAALAVGRREHGLPVFALEHGLDQNDLARITALLHARLRGDGRLSDHWLAWVVYAAEQGYNYDGAEYWTTFESRTPYWTLRADRRQLRGWFSKFHTLFNGLKPSGPWAKWFSIIAWPITHAVLPKDLQYQLAKALYVLRYQLSARINDQPAEIGRYVASCSYDASSRFRNFLEQEEIAGRIVLALLGGRTDEVQQSIHPLTLTRIVDDLQRAGNAREWLRDARRVVDSARMKGAFRSSGSGRPLDPVKTGLVEKPLSLAIRPSLVLRRTGVGEWTGTLELPSLCEVGDLAPELSDFLRKTRCSIAGCVGSLPAGWLMTGDQRRVLSSWPEVDRAVVKFERANATLDHLLQNDGRITSGPLWVFRVGSDGLAREIVGRLVRPGKNYILVSRKPMAILSLSELTSIKCGGVVAQLLTLPGHLSTDQLTELRSLGLTVAQTVRIWPAGLPARNWDGEGFTEWLEGEEPCFGIDHDHPISSFEVQLDSGPKFDVPPPPAGGAAFIKLAPLPIGTHSLFVRTKSAGGGMSGVNQVPIEGFVSLVVRRPRPWVSGTAGHTGLIVTVDPVEPSLDQFWEGEVRPQVLGPANYPINISVELLDGAGDNLCTEPVTSLNLPMTNEGWERAFAAFLRKELDPWAYLAASSGNLLVESDELGIFRVPLHRDVAPVRWVWHKSNRVTALRLIDDHEGDESLSVSFYAFARPTSAVTIEAERLKTDYEPAAPGGLCVASSGSQRQSLVVSMPTVDGGFSGLLIDPIVDYLPWDDHAVMTLLGLADMWSSARLVGPLAAARRDRVVQGLKQHVFRILCGHDWALAEANYLRSPGAENDLKRLADKIGDKPAFAFVLTRDVALLRGMEASTRLDHFVSLARRYDLARGNACKAALEFCEGIDQGVIFDGTTVDRYVADMRASPAVVRGARLLMLAKNNRETSAQAGVGEGSR
jgi:hypothetical protein